MLLSILALASLAQPEPGLPGSAGGQQSTFSGTLTRIDQSWWPRYADTIAVSNDGNDVLFYTGWDTAGARLSPAYSLPPQHIGVMLPESPGSNRLVRFGRSAMLIGGGRILYRRNGDPRPRATYVLRALDPVADPMPDVYIALDCEFQLVDGDWNPDTGRLWWRIAEFRGTQAQIVDRRWSVGAEAAGATGVKARPASRRTLSRPFTVKSSSDQDWFRLAVDSDGQQVVVGDTGGFSTLINLATGRRSDVTLGSAFGNADYVFLGGRLHAYCTYERTGPFPGCGVLRWDGRVWRHLTKDFKLDTASPNGRFAVLTRIEPAAGRSDHARYLWKP
jgi:hypothetical protein